MQKTLHWGRDREFWCRYLKLGIDTQGSGVNTQGSGVDTQSSGIDTQRKGIDTQGS